MKGKWVLTLLALACSATALRAQTLPRQVENVQILDLEGDAAVLPYWGEKNLMIFYVDPDRHKQNNDFTVEMEERHLAEGDNLFGFGVINLADAPMVPNGMARSMARKRTAKNGATVLADQTRALSAAWELGDCNNQFVLLLIDKQGQLVYSHKGILSDEDIAEFYRILEPYK